MFHSRLDHALVETGLRLPERGCCLALHPEQVLDLAPLRRLDLQFLHRLKPQITALETAGYTWCERPEASVDLAVVYLPRSKRLARHLVFAASRAAPDGVVLVDGAKSQGIESLIKALKGHETLLGSVSKAHGKLVWFRPETGLPQWQADAFEPIEEGFVTRPGVFSAAAIDQASRFLAETLPNDISGNVADFGAGWGYLSRHLLQSPALKKLYCVEADRAALDCLAKNCPDPRVQVEWQDVAQWRAPQKLDAVIMNPPFHIGRAAEPRLGQDFIRAAADNLTPRGRLFLVANRSLPYETTLSTCFKQWQTLAQANGFKILTAERPLARKE
ncbi:class I SAM-dependent methyltransferase [Paracoccaceae bacterium]|nr:class I SAM-dependent methyltransferase [Paracoccaceae bacterium]